MKHIHSEAIHAWAEGHSIQKMYKLCCDERDEGRWVDCKCPTWYEKNHYRIKPYNEQWEEGNE